MNSPTQILTDTISKILSEKYQVSGIEIVIQPTRKEFPGSHTFTVFQAAKLAGKNPEILGNEIGNELKLLLSIKSFNVVKGFLNIEFSNEFWLEELININANPNYGDQAANGKTALVEYSSPNTNKPLHLGHLRNNFLGYSVAKILEANGYQAIKANLVNDRGIHICKSMLAYQLFGNDEQPNQAPDYLKGDHLVGKYYVVFDKKYKLEQNEFIIDKIENDPHYEFIKKILENDSFFSGIKDFYKLYEKLLLTRNKENKITIDQKDTVILNNLQILFEEAEKQVPLILDAQKMLKKWESGDKETVSLWKKMNSWVYKGFEQTYLTMGVSFDKIYYESNTYLLGKEIVNEGLSKQIFFPLKDNSIWVDLSDIGLDQKLLLRGDGTSVYITQDLGTADLKYNDFKAEKSIYVVGNEQDYHFKVLFEILKRLGKPYANGLYHLSYGMVELPSGRMKSREGTVVDADDLMAEMVKTAGDQAKELGKIEGFSEEELESLFKTIGIGALKYYLLKVDPKKKMMFNPEESIELQGHTGPFIQYTYARIRAILRKAKENGLGNSTWNKKLSLHVAETELIVWLEKFPETVSEAGNTYSPALIANYVYELAKAYNRFYTEVSIFNADDDELLAFRLCLSSVTSKTIQRAMELLGINVPERM
jgi:arginyl-tRNA synthetase